MESSQCYSNIVAAYVRGRRVQSGVASDEDTTGFASIGQLSDDDIGRLLEIGRTQALPLHYFKRVRMRPRMQWVLGVLRSLQPDSLLDIGSGRGKFLWPLLDALPDLPVTAVDQDPARVRNLEAVSLGGITQLTAKQADARRLPFDNDAFDVVTMLEVLEHIPDPQPAVAEAIRVARRGVIASVPSQPDENPEHLHLFTAERLRALFTSSGTGRVKVQAVQGHWLIWGDKYAADA